MAVSIDTVYQRVLAIANKEQRGYITPQEFNLFANQAQMDVFEQYFYDYNQFGRAPGNDTLYSDMLDILESKIDLFQRYNEEIIPSTIFGDFNLSLIDDFYRFNTVRVKYSSNLNLVEAEKVRIKDLTTYGISPLTRPTRPRPHYVVYPAKDSDGIHNVQRIKIYPYPSLTEKAYVSYIAKPQKVVWGYTMVGDNALYNEASTATFNFQLHVSEENNLVMKILALAGISIKDPTVYQAASAEENKSIQQQKQ